MPAASLKIIRFGLTAEVIPRGADALRALRDSVPADCREKSETSRAWRVMVSRLPALCEACRLFGVDVIERDAPAPQPLSR